MRTIFKTNTQTKFECFYLKTYGKLPLDKLEFIGVPNMIDKLDNANVLMLSEKGDYGSTKIVGDVEPDIKICYLAICQYPNDERIYVFYCDENMSVEQDSLLDSVDEAIELAQQRSSNPIVWECYDSCE